MTCTRRHHAVGFWAVLLLLLAVSPVTAPFSFCDLGDLFADRDLHGGGILQSKTAKDDAKPSLSTTAFVIVLEAQSADSFPQHPHTTLLSRTLDIPLRL